MEKNYKINIFWHICAMNNWREIVEDQISTLEKSGLLSECEKVHVTFLGDNIDDISWLIKDKIKIRNFSENLKHYEKICLNDLRDWCQLNDSYVFYFHSKGVSKPEFKENIWEWRKMMEYFLVNNYEKCINLLSSYDVLGISLCDAGTSAKINDETHKFHFSGNFWWSKTDYLKKLPKIPDVDMSFDCNYFLCERWILQPWPDVNLLEIYRPRFPHYYDTKVDDNYFDFQYPK